MTETTKYIGGEYKILQQFGGAMGHVFLVEKQGIGFPFVLKSYQDIKPHLEELKIGLPLECIKTLSRPFLQKSLTEKYL